jgi:hypothetical protein
MALGSIPSTTLQKNIGSPFLYEKKDPTAHRMFSPLQHIPILIPRTCDYVTLHSRIGFADMIKDFEMGIFS